MHIGSTKLDHFYFPPLAHRVYLWLILLHGCCSLETMGSWILLWGLHNLSPTNFQVYSVALSHTVALGYLCQNPGLDEAEAHTVQESFIWPAVLGISSAWWAHYFCGCCWSYKTRTKLGCVRSPVVHTMLLMDSVTQLVGSPATLISHTTKPKQIPTTSHQHKRMFERVLLSLQRSVLGDSRVNSAHSDRLQVQSRWQGRKIILGTLQNEIHLCHQTQLGPLGTGLKVLDSFNLRNKCWQWVLWRFPFSNTGKQPVVKNRHPGV